MPGSPLVLTGERTLPGIAHENYWFARHVVAYDAVLPAVRGRRVLDAGAGEGYGAEALRLGGAAALVAVELEHPVVVHATLAYPQVLTVEADLAALPLRIASVDLAVSFQVIEHLHDVEAYVAELARVLAPGATLWCATPNRLTFTPDSDVPRNPFHVKEFTAAQLRAALARHLRVDRILGVHHGPRLRAVEAERGRSLTDLVIDHPPGRRPGWLDDVVASVTAADFEVHATGVDSSLDLLAVATKA